MWIMLVSKLPTEVSPPKMSIFWSTPWPDDHYAKQQLEQFEDKKDQKQNDDYEYFSDVFGDNPETATFYSAFGKDPNWIGARKIHFADRDIRIFPNEFSIMKPGNMHLYIFGDHFSSPSHKLVPENIAEDQIVKGILEGDDKFIYDAALVDGCTPAQAMSTALGMDITIPDSQFFPIGWYRPEPWILEIFCKPWESTEDRVPKIEDVITEETLTKKRKRKYLFSLLGE